jgi:hypothetical protein
LGQSVRPVDFLELERRGSFCREMRYPLRLRIASSGRHTCHVSGPCDPSFLPKTRIATLAKLRFPPAGLWIERLLPHSRTIVSPTASAKERAAWPAVRTSAPAVTMLFLVEVLRMYLPYTGPLSARKRNDRCGARHSRSDVNPRNLGAGACKHGAERVGFGTVVVLITSRYELGLSLY